MDAPKGRYRVEEKDGRLTVIDTAAGTPASGVSPPRPAPPPPGGGAVSTPLGLIDLYGRLLLSLVARRDAEGRAVIAWEWEQNGRKKRWDAALGPGEQKRLGRALAAFSAFPFFVLLTLFAGFGVTWLLLPVALGMTFRGVWSILRLQRETGAGGGG